MSTEVTSGVSFEIAMKYGRLDFPLVNKRRGEVISELKSERINNIGSDTYRKQSGTQK